MDVMRDLNRQGLVTDEYMAELEAAHRRDASLQAFGEFVDSVKDQPGATPFRGSGGNKKRRKVAERIKKRKAQKAARRRARA